MNRALQCVSIAAIALGVTTSQAHVLWINVVPVVDEHVIVSLAYGDHLPGSELLSTEWGSMSVQSYELVAPNGARSSLDPPTITTPVKKTLDGGLALQAVSDTGVRKVAFSPQAGKGTYQVAAQTPIIQYTKYRDRSGATRYTDQAPSKIANAAEILDHSFDVMFMKATFSVGGWSEPQPVGQFFEIVPLTDLSEARVGDLVRFKVLLGGRAWTPQGLSPVLSATNAGLGDTWGVSMPLNFGEGAFRLSHAGLWRIHAAFKASAGSDERFGKLAPTAAKDTPMYFDTTFVMNVKP